MELADLAQVRFVCQTKILLKCGLPSTAKYQVPPNKERKYNDHIYINTKIK